MKLTKNKMRVAFRKTASSHFNFSTLYSFDIYSGPTPSGILVSGAGGIVYGTTVEGGNKGQGSIFEITPNGTFRTLHSFSGMDGSRPNALLLGKDGFLYGTTRESGPSIRSTDVGVGTVFRLTPNSFTDLTYSLNRSHDWSTMPIQSGWPSGTLNVSSSLNWGVGHDWGAFALARMGDGTVFCSISHVNAPVDVIRLDGPTSMPRLKQMDILKHLHKFSYIVLGHDGNFYGLLDPTSPNDYFTFCRISQSGLITKLHKLNEFGENEYAMDRQFFFQGKDECIYGVARCQSRGGNDGTVFKISPKGAVITLHKFHGPDGSDPMYLVQDIDGTLFGVAHAGGKGDGVVFRLSSTGKFTVLHTFNGKDGSLPNCLILGDDGSLYGTTEYGGKNGRADAEGYFVRKLGGVNSGSGWGYGTIFKLTPPSR